ncbi:hypothetical protein GJAV_G00070670, partial [Gymnothorax javanicus]
MEMEEMMTLGGEDSMILSQLRSKYAVKPWNETFQLVSRCKDKSKSDSRSSQLYSSCLGRLTDAQNVSSLTAMVSKLEMIAKQRGLGSHRSPTETTCYLTSDMFYLEVLLQPGGDVEDVKVAHHGEAPVSWEPLLTLLRLKRFEEFSMKLECLTSLYNIHGDNEVKLKIYSALQHLEIDLIKISQLPKVKIKIELFQYCCLLPLIDHDLHVDTILNGRIGKVTLRKQDNPLSIKYYVSPYDLLAQNAECNCGLGALVTAGASDSTHRLQMTSLIQKPPIINAAGLPEFSPLDSVNTEVLPACFFLKLQPPLPMQYSFIHRMYQITEITLNETDLQWLPFPQLLKSLGESGFDSLEEEDAHYSVPLPDDEMHCYVLPEEVWGAAALKGMLVTTVPFTHPSHVPALLEVLRLQAAVNTLLSSFITHHRPCQGSMPNLHCEVIPESDSSFSVSFPLPDQDCLGVLLVNLTDSRTITGKLFTPCSENSSIDDYITRVLKRCMSIPLVMRAICRRLVQIGSSDVVTSTSPSGHSAHAAAATPASCSRPDVSAADAPCALSVGSEAAFKGDSSVVISQNASVTDSSSGPVSPVCSDVEMSAPVAQSAAGADLESSASAHPGMPEDVLQTSSAN